jgi:phage terminase small subunit
MSEPDDALHATADLTDRQHVFVREYCGRCRGNATKAAIAAGYSPKTAYSYGQQTLKKLEVRRAIQAWHEAEDQAAVVSADERKRVLSEIIRGTGPALVRIEGKKVVIRLTDEIVHSAALETAIKDDGSFAIRRRDPVAAIRELNRMEGIGLEPPGDAMTLDGLVAAIRANRRKATEQKREWARRGRH